MLKSRLYVVALWFAIVALGGCASTKVIQQTPMVAAGLPRPNRIWVYDFVATPSDMPANSSIGGEVGAPSTPPTAEQIQQARQYGAMIA